MMLEHEFRATTLHVLRKTVLAHAVAAGMPDERAVDVMLAIHELAANAVRHGAGSGQLRMQATAGTLHCQVRDAGPVSRSSEDLGSTEGEAPWPVQQGHGLWLVHKAADQVSMLSGPGGSQVTAVFALPSKFGDAPSAKA
jgi:anti-sigma regulatory factor (Ser/Thr protein kinase)